MKKLIGKILSIESVLVQAYVILLLGMTIPYGIPLFSPIIFAYFLIYFMKNALKGSITLNLNREIILFYLCVLIYLIGIVFSGGKIYQSNIQEIKNIIGLLLIAFMLNHMTEERYVSFINIYSRITVIVLSVSAFIAAYSFLNLITSSSFGVINITREKAFIGAATTGSYNMFVLGMFAGILAAFYCFSRAESYFAKIAYASSTILMIGVIVLAGSRRGWIVLGLLFLYYFVKMMIRVGVGFVEYFGYINKKSLKNILSIFLIFTACIGMMVFAMERFRIVRKYELQKLEYRFNTVFSKQGDIGEAFAKRTARWDYAGDLLEKYSIYSLFYGSGFNYLYEYATEFHADGNEDNPHNIFLSGLFYSGVIGLGVMIITIVIASMKLIFNADFYGEQFVLLFFVSLLFVSPGANSLFSVRLFPLILITIFSVRKSRTNQSALSVV